MFKPLRALLAAAALLLARPAAADAPAFDLAGPALRVSVERAGVTLPIARTPDLAEGDRVTVRIDLPASQASPYLLVTAFLRGATDPPPRDWFARAETWTAKGRAGLSVTVPPGARQALVFLVPRTSGDFATVMGAVRARPGAFVRASQDLTQASLDRTRLTAFLAALRRSQAAGPDDLAKTSALLARSLDLKLNPECLQRAPELQAACLLQGRDALVLNDGHSRSIVEALTGGPASDLALHLSASPAAGYGATSPYVGAVLDIARLLDSLRTAQFQYIPALEDAEGERLSLVLNAAPSFQNPRSVIVAALPPVEVARPPPLHAIDPAESFCLARPGLVLPVAGAPLAFSTAFAHDLVLHAASADGRGADLPVTADAGRGGLVVGAGAVALEGPLTGTLRGGWGFSRFEGPAFHLQGVRSEPWRASDSAGLVVGRDDTVRLEGPSACVARVGLQLGSEPPRDVAWKPAGAEAIAVTAPLTDAPAGPAALLVWRYGSDAPQRTPIQLFAQAAHLDDFALHAGDLQGVLTGSRLDQVSTLAFAGVDFVPGPLATVGAKDELTLTASAPGPAAQLAAGRSAVARVGLKDGRTLRLGAKVRPARLQASLISLSRDGEDTPGPLKLTPDDLPRGAQVTFSLQAQGAARFSKVASVEVDGPNDSPAVIVTPADGLTELDPGVLVVRLDTAKAFGASVYGPLRFRVVQDGAASDWRPLATLVRTPSLHRLRCPAGATRTCELEGDDLFLIEAVSNDPAFHTSTPVAEGYTGRVLAVPHPRADGRLFVRLHDDPARPVTVSF